MEMPDRKNKNEQQKKPLQSRADELNKISERKKKM